MAQTKVFTAAFGNPDQPEQQVAAPQEPRKFATAGDSTRDSVRKLLFEIFAADCDDEKLVASLIESLESEISKDCPDPKSRQYRDSSRQLQTKLKGPRFAELRRNLLDGEVKVAEVCSQDFLTGKTNPGQSKPSTGPRSGTPGMLQRQGGVPARGMPGQPVKPRGMIPGGPRPTAPQIKRPMPMSPMGLAPAQSTPVLPSATLHEEQKEDNSWPTEQHENNQVEEIQPQRQVSQETPAPDQIVEARPSNQQTLETPAEETRPSEVEEGLNSTRFESFTLDRSQLNQSQLNQTLVSEADQSVSLEQSVDLTSPRQAGKKKKKKKGGKKQKSPEARQEEPAAIPEAPELSSPTLPPQQEVKMSPKTPEIVKESQRQPEPSPPRIQQEQPAPIEETKEEVKVAKHPSIPRPPIQIEVPDNNQEPRDLKPVEHLAPVVQHSRPSNLSQVIASPSGASRKRDFQFDSTEQQRVDQLIAENQRLRQSLRQQAYLEDQIMHQAHQLQLLQAQLRSRDDQLHQLRWQVQQIQSQNQREVDEMRMRFKRIQQESQQYRETLQDTRVQAQNNQQQSSQPESLRQPQPRREEADRGGNFLPLPTRFQQSSQENMEAQVESGEADEGGRDDGHFYRAVTQDEGTGGAGFSEIPTQTRVLVDASSSGSGQLPFQPPQRFDYQHQQQDGSNTQQINEDSYDEEEDAHQNQQQFQEQQYQRRQHREESSGSAFGEGNHQQDDSEEEGMGMGMGNRQGSGHEVEDESGSLDVVAQSSNQIQNCYKFGGKQREEVANSQSDHDQAQQRIAEADQSVEHHSLSEEGGCRSNNSEDQAEHSPQNLMEHFTTSRNRTSSASQQQDQYESDSPKHSNQQNYYMQVDPGQDLEEEKEEPMLRDSAGGNGGYFQVRNNNQLGNQVGDNLERPSPYQPRQQTARQSQPNSAVNPQNQSSSALHSVYQQNQTFMQGESMSQQYQDSRSGVPQIQPLGTVAVATRTQRPDNQRIQDSHSAERPGPNQQPQQRGRLQNKFQPPIPTSSQSNNSTRGQGQGGGVVNNSQSNQRVNGPRITRGAQRPQQVNQYQPVQTREQSGIEQSPPRGQQLRPPASQASSAAQLPLQQQNSGNSNVTQREAQSQNQQNQPSPQGVCHTLPASQASSQQRPSSGYRQQQSHNSQPPAISGQHGNSRVPEGVVHQANYPQQNASNTQAHAGAMMCSSGSAFFQNQQQQPDMGGLADRNRHQQMNAESGSTTSEFFNQRQQATYLMGGLPQNASYQSVSSPPSTQQQMRQSAYTQLQQQSMLEQDAGASGGAECELFVASVGATPLAQNARGAISQAQLPPQQQFVVRQNQQQSYYQQRHLSGSGEAEQNASSGGVANTGNQGESGANIVAQRQYQQQQAHTDSRKTSGANTPSKDGANTPPYRDQMQNNSQIFNLTSKRLIGLQQQQNQQQFRNQPQLNISDDNADEMFRGRTQQDTASNRVIPGNMFE